MSCYLECSFVHSTYHVAYTTWEAWTNSIPAGRPGVPRILNPLLLLLPLRISMPVARTSRFYLKLGLYKMPWWIGLGLCMVISAMV